MKRQVLAVLIGSLFALPALATDGEIDNGFTPNVRPESIKSRAQVHAELVAAKQALGFVDGEIGNTAPAVASSYKTRAEVVAEIDGHRAIDGETGQPVPHA
jgi:hypothetical protein